MRRRPKSLLVALVLIATTQTPSTAHAQGSPKAGKPNILVIFGDDIGIANVSA